MDITGLKCTRCGERSMFLKPANGYLECSECGKKEAVDDGFTMIDFWTLVRSENQNV